MIQNDTVSQPIKQGMIGFNVASVNKLNERIGKCFKLFEHVLMRDTAVRFLILVPDNNWDYLHGVAIHLG